LVSTNMVSTAGLHVHDMRIRVGLRIAAAEEGAEQGVTKCVTAAIP
jgi:hypothetical protein